MTKISARIVLALVILLINTQTVESQIDNAICITTKLLRVFFGCRRCMNFGCIGLNTVNFFCDRRRYEEISEFSEETSLDQ